MSIAYAPRGGFTAENFGTVAVGDHTLNLNDALTAGDGVVVVPEADTLLQAVLDEMPALKRVAVPEGARLSDGLDALPASSLRDEAKQRGLRAVGAKDDLIAAIRTHDATQAGDTQSADLATSDKEED